VFDLRVAFRAEIHRLGFDGRTVGHQVLTDDLAAG
jgi:hypothetical protein